MFITSMAGCIRRRRNIELLKGADNTYNLDYSVTANQKAILNAFGMTAKNINRQAMDISSDLARIEIEAAEAGAAKNSGKVSGE